MLVVDIKKMLCNKTGGLEISTQITNQLNLKKEILNCLKMYRE